MILGISQRVAVDEKTGEIIPEQENIFISSPSIYENKDEMKYMYPNEARLKNLTYQSCVFCNIGIKYTFMEEDERFIVRNFKQINLGQIHADNIQHIIGGDNQSVNLMLPISAQVSGSQFSIETFENHPGHWIVSILTYQFRTINVIVLKF